MNWLWIWIGALITFIAPVADGVCVTVATLVSILLPDSVTGTSKVETHDPTGAKALALAVAITSRQHGRGVSAVSIGILVSAFLSLETASASDVTSSVHIAHSGFVLDRTSGTCDTQVTVRNKSSDTLLGPLRLVLESASPVDVVLYNSHGKTGSGADFVVLPLSAGVLAPGQATTGLVKLINADQGVTRANFGVQAETMNASNSAQIDVSAFLAAGINGDQIGAGVGAGWVVQVDGVTRGVTDSAGTLSIKVPLTSGTVSVHKAPNWGGSAFITALTVGQTKSLQVLVDDSKEIAEEGLLRFDQVRQSLLSPVAPRISLRFLKHEQLLPMARLNWVQLIDEEGHQANLTKLFAIQGDGTISASPSAFFQALPRMAGRLNLDVSASTSDGAVLEGHVDFRMADFRVRIQLSAPPSRPDLALGGLTVTGTILDTGIRFVASSDATGHVSVPKLPAGNLRLHVTTTSAGLVYTGMGTTAIAKDLLLKVVLRGPQEVLHGLPPIVAEPLAPGTSTDQRIDRGRAPEDATRKTSGRLNPETRNNDREPYRMDGPFSCDSPR